MAECFTLLRGTPDGPVYLTWIEAPAYADTWTPDRADARRFIDRDDAEQIRRRIVLSDGFAVAVVPDRVGPGPDRPAFHSYAEARREHRVATADLAAAEVNL